MKFHRPTDEEWEKVEMAATAMVLTLLQNGGPGFAGAVVTTMLGNVLAALDDDLAEKALAIHVEQARAIRAHVRKQFLKMEQQAQWWEAPPGNEDSKH